MRYQILIFGFITALLCTFCKKNAQPANEAEQPAPTNMINGIFVNTHQVNNNVPSGTLNTTSIVMNNVFFEPATGIYDLAGKNYADVGKVFVNQKETNKASNPFFYTYDIHEGYPLTYSITGKDNFAPLNFNDSGSAAAGFSNYDQFPNSISKTAGLTFTLANLVNTNAVEVSINNTSFGFLGNIINISSAELSTIATSTFSTVRITCKPTNNYFLYTGGKVFLYTGTFIYFKQGVSITP
jgi:hypothetical protein